MFKCMLYSNQCSSEESQHDCSQYEANSLEYGIWANSAGGDGVVVVWYNIWSHLWSSRLVAPVSWSVCWEWVWWSGVWSSSWGGIVGSGSNWSTTFVAGAETGIWSAFFTWGDWGLWVSAVCIAWLGTVLTWWGRVSAAWGSQTSWGEADSSVCWWESSLGCASFEISAALSGN